MPGWTCFFHLARSAWLSLDARKHDVAGIAAVQ
jgi:hypothetical protein